jgi:transposase InsO family protein
MAQRTAWRICSQLGRWSAFGKKRGKNGKKPGPPVHGHPKYQRHVEVAFWEQIARGRLPEELRIAIVRWIEKTYHRRRRQAALGRLTPIECELIMTSTATQAA